MQPSNETNPCENLENVDTYNEYYKLLDVVLKAALDELKLRSIDRRGAQDAKLRQLLYLCIVMMTFICGVVVMTPYWSGDKAVLHGASGWHMALLFVSFALCVGGGIYGVWSLMGERGGSVPIIPEYTDILRKGYGADGSGKPYEAALEWLQNTDSALDEYASLISSKGKKIRTLNWTILCAAGCAAFAAFALFSTTLLENYVRQYHEVQCVQASHFPVSEKDGRRE